MTRHRRTIAQAALLVYVLNPLLVTAQVIIHAGEGKLYNTKLGRCQEENNHHETVDKTAEVTQIEGAQVQVLSNNVASYGAKVTGQNLVQVEGADKTALYAVNEEHLSKADSQSRTSLLGVTYNKSTSNDSTFNSTALGTTLTSQEAIKVGVGATTDVRGAILSAPKVDFYRSAGADTSKPGELSLGASTNTAITSHTEKTTTAGVWQNQSGQGGTTETAKPTQINGQLNIEAGINTAVQIPEGQLKDQIQSLSQQPGMGYLKELASKPGINWEQIKLANEQWSYSQQGLTPAGAALVAIAVAVYTGGMGAELLGTTTATATGSVTTLGGMTLGTTTAATATAAASATTFAAGAALNAGVSALASSAAVSFVNNGGDIGKTLSDMGSSQNVKNVLTAMATAGVLSALGSAPTATGQTGANAQVISTTQALDKFTANLMQNVTNNMASAVVNSAINGKPLNEETLKTALSSAFITAGMAQTANSIGAATTGDNPALNTYTQAMAHALAGCVGGAATTGNSGGCSAGAVGAVVGELSAKFAMESGMDGAGALKLATTMSAAAGALVGGPDSAAAVNVASQMGANAAANNALTGKQQQAKDLLKQQAKNPQDIANIDAAFKELDAVQTKALVSATNAKDAYALATTAQEKRQAYEQLKSAYSDLGDIASALTKQGDGAGAAVYGKAALTTYLTLQVAANEAGQQATPLTPAQRDLVTKQFIELGVALDSSDSAVARSALQKLNSMSSPGVAKVGGSGANGGQEAKLPTATDATATSPYSSSGTSYGKTTFTDVNGKPIPTQPALPNAGVNGSTVGKGATGAVDDVAPVTSGGTANAANGNALGDSLASQMPKPTNVSNPQLSGMMDDLYRDGAKIGSGSTADAVRYEKATGQPVGGVFHTQKAWDYSAGLQRWLNNNPNSAASDIAAAQNVLRDLLNALRGK